METKDRIFVLLALGGLGYAAYANWDVISDKLGLHELDPGLVKAIELTKKARNFGASQTNWQHLESRQQLEEIEIAPDPWTAVRTGEWSYRVTVTWSEDAQPVTHAFAVDVKTRNVRHEGAVESPPAGPR